MSSSNEQDPRDIPLTVLPHSGKVDQLRHEAHAAPKPEEPATAREPSQTASIAPAISIVPAASIAPTASCPPVARSLQQKLLEGKVIEAISQVYDPEIPINIYELGLIYAIDVRDDNSVHVKMTLTAPACPVAGSLPGEVEQRIENIPEVKSADVELVWDPPWGRDRMSEAAQLELGLL